MTSEERREERYQRRKARRAAVKERTCSLYDDFEWVFSFEHLYLSYLKCRRGVSWKASVQRYISRAPLIVSDTYDKLHNGTYRSKGFFEFDLCERGKKRHIRSVTIDERVVQRCLCDYALVPMLKRTLIYDNGASLEHKGYHFSVSRLCTHLRRHIRKHGVSGYIGLYDFTKFFDNISHEVCRKVIRKEFKDERIIALTEHFIDMFGDKGLGLGSQISQTFALVAANRLDHYAKETLGIKGYGRYMDDGYLIHESRDYLRECFARMEKVCEKLGLEFSRKKTRIVSLRRGFTYLKIKFSITDTGKIIRRIHRRSVTRERRKLKKFRGFLEHGEMDITDIEASFQTWMAYAQGFDAHKTIMSMKYLYRQLFVNQKTGGN